VWRDSRAAGACTHPVHQRCVRVGARIVKACVSCLTARARARAQQSPRRRPVCLSLRACLGVQHTAVVERVSHTHTLAAAEVDGSIRNPGLARAREGVCVSLDSRAAASRLPPARARAARASLRAVMRGCEGSRIACGGAVRGQLARAAGARSLARSAGSGPLPPERLGVCERVRGAGCGGGARGCAGER